MSEKPEIGGRYAKYVLFVLVIVYIFNFIDRQILSILAEDIKADLQIGDAEIGFLYGTAFAVFYAIFGIPLGRLADNWTRKSLISIGLLIWSAMTALSGTARSFASLAAYRIGVGIGEASASPAAFSMLSDYFPPRLRTTAIAVYSSGVYIGSGIGIFLGGVILGSWAELYPDVATAPMQLKGWHVAFFVVGIPGVLMSLWVWTLKEPQRGASEGIVTPDNPEPFKGAFEELLSIVPGLHWVNFVKMKATSGYYQLNLLMLVVVLTGGYGLITVTGSVAQWVALGIGLFAAFSWAQSLALRDRATFEMIFKTKTLLYAVVAFPTMSFVTYGVGFWGPPFFQRVHGVTASEAGIVLGLSAAVGGWLGVTMGGVIADMLRRHTSKGKIFVGIASVILSAPVGIALLTTEDLTTAYILNFIFSVTSPMWVGPGAATVNDLVMPRMRAMASAFYLLMVTFIGLALGPYLIGQISDTLVASGEQSSAALQQGMLTGLCIYVLSLTMFVLAALNVEKDESTRIDRARALGEVVE